MLAWVAASAFLIAASWPHISESQLPFMDCETYLRPMSAGPSRSLH